MEIRPYFLLTWKSPDRRPVVMFRTRITPLLALVLLLSGCSDEVLLPVLESEPPYAADSGNLLIQCGTLIDGVGDTASGPTAILVENGRIAELGQIGELTTELAHRYLSV